MRELAFEIVDWLGADDDDPASRATLASLTIKAGPDHLPVTEVEDTLARTVRTHINVPAYSVARWLLANWWRLRWEPRPIPGLPERDWRQVHSMASLGGGYAWPALEFSSDGDFIQLQLEAETTADVSAIRYLRTVILDIPATDFEAAVERLVDQVEGRLAVCLPDERELSELRSELREELSDPDTARACRLQALSGIDPGAAPPEWLDEAAKLSAQVGPTAIDEIMAVLPALGGNLATAESVIGAMRGSQATLDLGSIGEAPPAGPGVELPWEKGSRLAAYIRKRLGIQQGPVSNEVLGEFLSVQLPLKPSPSSSTIRQRLRGGFRKGNGRTAILVPSRYIDSQRFYLARVIGCAMMSSAQQNLLPVTDAATALQKFERAFAQELLCPWTELDAFTQEHGLDENGIEEAASHFEVSSMVVLSTLVNKKKLPRHRLPLS